MFKRASKKLKRKKRLDPKALIAITATVSLLVFVLIAALWGYFSRKSTEDTDYILPLTVTNLTYCSGEKLDLFVPQSDRPVPLLIYIHGGGWRYGSKVGGMFPDLKPLIARGFAVASVNYRLSNRARFPAQIQDVLCSIRFLRAHAEEYNLDSNRFGAIGLSAGGHLAAMAATASDQSQFQTNDYKGQSSHVQAAVILSGLLDLADPTLNKATKDNIRRLLGPSPDAQASSPIQYLTPYDPPLFAMYGDHDNQVPSSQTLTFVQKAQSLGLSAQAVEVKSANHNLDPYFSLQTSPNKRQRLDLIANFFSKNLQ